MRQPDRNFPQFSYHEEVKRNHIAEAFPFYVKEYGYSSESKLTLGESNNFNDFLLLYSIDGTCRFTKLKSTSYIQQNTIVISACNTPITLTKVSKYWHYYYFIIAGSHAKLFYNYVRTKSDTIPDNIFTNTLDDFMDIFNLLSGETRSLNEPWKYMNISLLINRIFTSMYNLNENFNIAKKMTPARETDVNLAIKYIKEHYREPISVDNICNEIGFSKYYFCKLFKRSQGTTIYQYLLNYRIVNAKELLAYSKLSVNSIATHVGFKNSLAFIRAFERIENMTPSEYRSYYQ